MRAGSLPSPLTGSYRWGTIGDDMRESIAVDLLVRASIVKNTAIVAARLGPHTG